MKKEIVLTGIQPSGVITLGNYIGAIKQMVEYQDKYESIIFIADLHSITVPQDKNVLANNTRDLVALYLACGLDPKKNTIFLQSENPYHSNLAWLLECNTYFGELSRMHQFKEKSKKSDSFSVGLLTYPILMASDIILYDAKYVPVGGDQKQHVELARDIAIRFNKKYGQTFKIPEPLIPESATKIGDLIDPTKKMSKSSENQKGVIRILDDLDVVRKKIMGATTDSESVVKFDPINKPGISNLINIYSVIKGVSIKEVEEKFKDANYGTFKREVADTVCELLSGIQKRYKEIIDSGIIDKILDEGREKSMKIAKVKYELAKKNMGFYRVK